MNVFLKKLDKASSPWLRLGILETTLVRDDAIYIIKESFNELTKRDYFKYLEQKIFRFLADYPGFAEVEILYLLNSKNSLLHLLSPKQLSELIIYVPGIFEFIMDRFFELDLSNHALVRDLTNASLCDHNYFTSFARRILKSKSKEGINTFISTLATSDNFNDFNQLLPFIKGASYESVPSILSSNVYQNDDLRLFLTENFEALFLLERPNKMNFLDDLKYDLDGEVLKKYNYLISILQASNVPATTLERLNILLEYGEEDFIKDYIGDESISYLKSGSSAQAFRIGEHKVLKFAKMKHIPNGVYEHFLLEKTERKIITNSLNKPILYVERQDYLSQVYEGKPICSDDIENFFLEAKRQKLIIHDPHCVRRYTDNFGFLNDYHEAQLVGVNSYEELPDWFKRRPLVLFDIDMITRKQTNPQIKRRTLS